MTNIGADETVIDRLLGALEADVLPEAARDPAEVLIKRLSNPVRVAVMGLPEAGKSQLINMFVGEQVVPSGRLLPTTEFVWGKTPAMILTTADGQQERIEVVDLAALSDFDVAFLRVELPVDILKKISLLEVVAGGEQEELERALDWARRRTDIALWCTQLFEEVERAVWSKAPDALKDHGFLVLTKADILSAEQALKPLIATLNDIVAEEFYSLYPVATLQAIRAQEGESVDAAMLKASGAVALVKEVLRHAERGRRADFDSAHMFLARYKIGEDVAPSKTETEAATAEPEEDAPVAEQTPLAAPEPVAKTALSEDQHAPKTAAKETAAPATPTADERVKVENVTLFADAIGYLRRRGDGLSNIVQSLSAGESGSVVQHCLDAVEHLTDLFSQDESGCAAADSFIDDLSEASDMMVLFQAEAGDMPAADAVTLLLQLRRDMEMQLAA